MIQAWTVCPELLQLTYLKRVYVWLEVQLVFGISAACYRKYFFCCDGVIAYNQRVKCAENSSV